MANAGTAARFLSAPLAGVGFAVDSQCRFLGSNPASISVAVEIFFLVSSVTRKSFPIRNPAP